MTKVTCEYRHKSGTLWFSCEHKNRGGVIIKFATDCIDSSPSACEGSRTPIEFEFNTIRREFHDHTSTRFLCSQLNQCVPDLCRYSQFTFVIKIVTLLTRKHYMKLFSIPIEVLSNIFDNKFLDESRKIPFRSSIAEFDFGVNPIWNVMLHVTGTVLVVDEHLALSLALFLSISIVLS